jgi:hypothetical protein
MSQQIAFLKIAVSSSIDLSYLDNCCIDTLNSITSSWIIADDYLETSINHKGGSQIKDYMYAIYIAPTYSTKSKGLQQIALTYISISHYLTNQSPP